MKKLLKRINRVIMALLLVVLICMVVIVLVSRSSSGESGPEFFGYHSYTVLSNSMSPHIKTGDMVIMKEVIPSDINTHDVIAFHKDGKIITHRVTNKKKVGKDVIFETKGDNNNVKDEGSVSGDDVVGKQVYHIPKGGYVAKFISSPIGLLLIVVLPLTGYLCLELFERLKKVKVNGEVKRQEKNNI